MGSFRKIAAAITGWVALSSCAFGYYHYVHYGTRTAPFTPIYEKFDLNALSNKTLYYFLPDQPAVQFGPNDSAASLLSQIRAAAKIWNDVGSSDLRLAYGGSVNATLPQTTPGVDVIFSELPPGLLALGAPTRRSAVNASGPAAFVPITRSVVQFASDLTQRPSYGDDFFLTAVHEFGHALGLQHTFTSATMSTNLTRSTSKADPLDADDIAGISLLYPASNFRSSTASISGRVTSGSAGMNLASVVAISPSGSAISTLTNPDGTYRIDGIPPGPYYFYVHPLPLPESGETTPGNITSQWDPDGNQPFPFSVGAGVSFSAQFFPGVKDWHTAMQITLSAGQSVDFVSFNVQRIARNPFNSIYTYGYPGNFWVQPPYVNFNGGRQLIMAGGNGLLVNGAPAPGLGVSVLGALATAASPRAFTADYLLIDFQEPQPAPPEGERHLVFTLNNEIYVLPAAFHTVHKQPPQIFGISPSIDATGRSTLVVIGSNLAADTVIMFDGQAATITEVLQGAVRVIPPSAASGQRAMVVALNSDGQSSTFLQGPPAYQYDILPAGTDNSFLTVSNTPLVPGTETMLEVNAAGRPLTDSSTILGFGSSDVVVRRSWITNNGSKILANVYVSPEAASAFLNLSIFSGLRGLALPFALQTLPPGTPALSLSSNVFNITWNNSSVIPGSTVSLPVSNLTAAAIQNGLSLTVGSVQATNIVAAPGLITFTVPVIPAGPEVVRLQTSTEQAAIVLPVENSPASVFSLTLNGVILDQTRGLRNGDVVTALVTGFGDLGGPIASVRARVNVGGVDQQVLQLVQASPGLHNVTFFVNGVTAGPQTLSVTVDNKVAAPASVFVR